MMSLIDTPISRIDTVSSMYNFRTTVDVLRLDELHPVVSGNKWFKLKEYLHEATGSGRKLLSFGGAWSNHIVALAAAAHELGLGSVGLIRGEKPSRLSYALEDALRYGMELHFLSRQDYSNKILPEEIKERCEKGEFLRVPEGGYGLPGVNGAMDILKQADCSQYDVIMTAVGTGTMLAGLAAGSAPAQKITGIAVLKDHSLPARISQLLKPGDNEKVELLFDFHFGGYARSSPELFSFMNNWYEKTGIPSDFVYTAKLFYAADHLLKKEYFPTGSRLLLIHSGGLQGNRSLPKGTLIF